VQVKQQIPNEWYTHLVNGAPAKYEIHTRKKMDIENMKLNQQALECPGKDVIISTKKIKFLETS
jgi:hypothetical protein